MQRPGLGTAPARTTRGVHAPRSRARAASLGRAPGAGERRPRRDAGTVMGWPACRRDHGSPAQGTTGRGRGPEGGGRRRGRCVRHSGGWKARTPAPRRPRAGASRSRAAGPGRRARERPHRWEGPAAEGRRAVGRALRDGGAAARRPAFAWPPARAAPCCARAPRECAPCDCRRDTRPPSSSRAGPRPRSRARPWPRTRPDAVAPEAETEATTPDAFADVSGGRARGARRQGRRRAHPGAGLHGRCGQPARGRGGRQGAA